MGEGVLALVLLLQTPAAPPRDATAAPEKAGTFVIRGRVTDAVSGQPLKGASVSVTPVGESMLPGRGALTDAGGKWQVTSLAAGDYTLSHWKTGYNRARGVRIYSPVHVSAHDPVRDIELVLMRGGVISGRVMDPSGEPAPGIRVAALRVVGGDYWGAQGDTTDDRGEFRLHGLEPGEFSLSATPEQRQAAMTVESPRSPVVTYFPRTAKVSEAERVTLGEQGEISDLGPEDQHFESPLAVGDQDLPDVQLVGRSATPIRGKIVMATPDEKLRPSTLYVRSEPLRPTGGGLAAKVEMVRDDWTFEIGTFWVPTVLAVPGLPPGWIVSSVQYAGREHVDSGLAPRDGQPIDDVQVVITSRGSRLSATVTDDKGASVRDYSLVVYAEDTERWGPLSRYRAIARPDQKGESLTDPLPAARYLVVAVSAIEDGAEADAAFLERLRPLATPVDLREGETHGLALALVLEP